MYIKLDEELYKRIKKTTMTDYDAKGNLVPAESIEPMLKDLLHEIDVLEEAKKDMERDIENNYKLKEVNPYTEYGISERDFI